MLYVGVQIVVAFAIVGLSDQPVTDIHLALWRVYGTLFGIAALFLAFHLVGPDYAGRPLVAPLQTSAAGCSGSSRGLADEARAEGVTSGADTQAAIAVAGRAARIGYRLAAVASGRSATARPPLSESMQTALGTVESAIRESLELALAL